MQFPLGKKLSGVWEPTVAATVVTPSQHVGSIMELFQDRRGEMTEHTVLNPARTLLRSASYGSKNPIHVLLAWMTHNGMLAAFWAIMCTFYGRQDPAHFAASAYFL